MPNYAGLITGLVIGNDFDFERTLTDVPVGAVLSKAWLTIKNNWWDADVDAIIQKAITSSANPGVGQITDTGADEIGTVFFQLTNTDTSLLYPDRIYWYDCQVKTNTGKIYTAEKGNFIPASRITQTTS